MTSSLNDFILHSSHKIQRIITENLCSLVIFTIDIHTAKCSILITTFIMIRIFWGRRFSEQGGGMIYHPNYNIYKDSINNIFLVKLFLCLHLKKKTGTMIIKRKLNYDLKGTRERKRRRNHTKEKVSFA